MTNGHGLEGGREEKPKNPRLEELKLEIADAEFAIEENRRRLQELRGDLAAEMRRDPYENAERRKQLLEHLDEGKKAIDEKFYMGRIFTWPTVTATLTGVFGATEVATVERLISMGKGAAVGAGLAGIFWAIQRMKYALEHRDQYRDARGG